MQVDVHMVMIDGKPIMHSLKMEGLHGNINPAGAVHPGQ